MRIVAGGVAPLQVGGLLRLNVGSYWAGRSQLFGFGLLKVIWSGEITEADVVRLGGQVVQVCQCFTANHLDAALGTTRGIAELFAPAGEPVKQMRVGDFPRHFGSCHDQVLVVSHVPEFFEFSAADFGLFLLHEDHVSGGLGEGRLHGGCLALLGVMPGDAYLGILERQFVRDFFGLVSGGVVHDQDFETRRYVRS